MKPRPAKSRGGRPDAGVKRSGKAKGAFKNPSKISKNPHHKSKPILNPTISALHAKSFIPFEPSDSILLIGEGDFSFAHSIVITRGLLLSTNKLTATCHEPSSSELLEKYPQAEEHIERLQLEGHKVLYGVDVKKYPKIVKKASYDAVIFNFPHTGGLTTDVARQTRANQELLLSFFNSTLPLLTLTGSIVVTLFDGLPYSEWDVRGLAKSVGLRSRRSFKFDARLYEGYKHARTIGNREREWKGEERPARTFVFEMEEATRRVAEERKIKAKKMRKIDKDGISEDEGEE